MSSPGLRLATGESMANHPLFLLAVAGVFGLGLGCSTPPPKSPDAELAKVDPPHNPDLGHYPSRATIDVIPLYASSDVRGACSGPDPFFSVDSTGMGRDDKASMDNLAQCMKFGPLKGKTIRLTGHTDPRGTVEYNDKLGMARAKKIKRHLVRRGVEGERILTASLGEYHASPFPQYWETDRRVDIELVQ